MIEGLLSNVTNQGIEISHFEILVAACICVSSPLNVLVSFYLYFFTLSYARSKFHNSVSILLLFFQFYVLAEEPTRVLQFSDANSINTTFKWRHSQLQLSRSDSTLTHAGKLNSNSITKHDVTRQKYTHPQQWRLCDNFLFIKTWYLCIASHKKTFHQTVDDRSRFPEDHNHHNGALFLTPNCQTLYLIFAMPTQKQTHLGTISYTGKSLIFFVIIVSGHIYIYCRCCSSGCFRGNLRPERDIWPLPAFDWYEVLVYPETSHQFDVP